MDRILSAQCLWSFKALTVLHPQFGQVAERPLSTRQYNGYRIGIERKGENS